MIFLRDKEKADEKRLFYTILICKNIGDETLSLA